MKVAVISDIHANLPELQAVLEAIRAEQCDLIYHLGDAIAIGPYPAECLDLILGTPNLQCVLGNHEGYYLHGIPRPQPAWMSDGEVQHQQWTHKALTERRRAPLSEWPMMIETQFEGLKTVFLHYGLAESGGDFVNIVRDAGEADLARIFGVHQAAIVFYGHVHAPSDVQGPETCYINPGSLGCQPQAVARYTIAEFLNGEVRIQHRSLPYDDRALYQAFEAREVPERKFIYRVFFGGRFQ